jgi:hypothetical protein
VRKLKKVVNLEPTIFFDRVMVIVHYLPNRRVIFDWLAQEPSTEYAE